MPVSSFSRCIYIEMHFGLASFLARDIGVDRFSQWDYGLLFVKVFPSLLSTPRNARLSALGIGRDFRQVLIGAVDGN